jgi:hypothetical protein
MTSQTRYSAVAGPSTHAGMRRRLTGCFCSQRSFPRRHRWPLACRRSMPARCRSSERPQCWSRTSREIGSMESRAPIDWPARNGRPCSAGRRTGSTHILVCGPKPWRRQASASARHGPFPRWHSAAVMCWSRRPAIRSERSSFSARKGRGNIGCAGRWRIPKDRSTRRPIMRSHCGGRSSRTRLVRAIAG